MKPTKAYKVKLSGDTAKGIGPLFFSDLFDALLGCARLRMLGFKPTLTRNPKPELITLAQWQAERGIKA